MDLRQSPEALAIREAYRRGELTRDEALARIEALETAPAPPAGPWGGAGRSWPEPPGPARRGAALTARIGLPIAGGVFGGLPGAAAGGAAGETLGELLEGDALSAARIGTAGLLSFLPAIRAPGITSTLGRVGLRAAEGAGQGALGTWATRYVGEGRQPTGRELATGAVLGAGLGAAAGGVEARLSRPAPAPRPAPPDVGTPPAAPAASAVDELVQPAAARTAARKMFRPNPDELMPPPVGPAERAAAARDAGKLERIEASVERLYGDMPEPAKQILRDINSRYEDEILAATGGVQPITRTQQLAATLQVDLEKLVRPGTPLDRNQLANLEGAQRALMARSAALLERTDLSDAVLGRELTTAAEDLKRLQTVIIGATSEAGGVLRYRREAVRRSLPPLSQFQRAALESQADPIAVARAMKALGPDPTPDQMMQALVDLQHADWQTKVRSLYLMNILANWKTVPQRNPFGNFVRLVQDPVLKPVAAGLDVARAAATGTERRTFAGEVKPFAAGVVDAAPDAIRAFFQIMRQGWSHDEALRLVLGDPKFQLPREVWKGPLKPLNLVSRALSATDALFRTMNAAGQLRAAAYAQARRELLRQGRPVDRTALARRMAEIVDARPPALLEDVEHAAARSVYQENVPAWVADLDRSIANLPLAIRAPVRMWVPFIRTPSNIVKQGLEVSPLGFAMRTARESSRLGDTARAEAAFGTLLAGFVAYETVVGNIRGNAPSEPKARELFFQSGPENSVRIGNQWRQFSDLGHIGIAMSTVANLVQGLQRAGRESPTTGEALGIGRALVEGVLNAGGSVFDISFLQGMGELFDLIRNPTWEQLERTAQRRVTSLLPLQGFLRPVAEAQDPYLRQARGSAEALATQIPGLRQTVPPRLGAFGEPQERAFSGPRNAFLILPSAPVREPDPVFAELGRLGIPPAAAKRGDTLRSNRRIYAITRDEDLALRQVQGRAERASLERLLAGAWYAQLDDDRRRLAVQGELARAAARVRERAKVLKARGQTITEEALR